MALQVIATEEASTPGENGKNKKVISIIVVIVIDVVIDIGIIVIAIIVVSVIVIVNHHVNNTVQVTMEKMIEMQKKRKEEKPVAMLIKGGMLFKDGKTTEEKKVDFSHL